VTALKPIQLKPCSPVSHVKNNNWLSAKATTISQPVKAVPQGPSNEAEHMALHIQPLLSVSKHIHGLAHSFIHAVT